MKFDDFWGLLCEHADDIPPDLIKVANPAIRDENGKLPVDKVFAKPGVTMPWFECELFPTPQDLMNDFDKPEELTTIQGPPSGICVIRKKDGMHLRAREDAVYQVLKENGIDNYMDLNDVSWERLQELRDEIERRVKASGAE